MDWLTKMNEAVDYIELNLGTQIDFARVAQKACCSSYNFQRMFSFITNVTLSDYIRRRRMTQAALDLQNKKINLIDISLKYGYESSASFSRAFSDYHGISPKDVKKGVELKLFPKMSFQITIKGGNSMQYRIEEKASFEVFGIETVASLSDEGGFVSPAQLWKNSQADGTYEKLLSDSGDLPDFLAKDLCRIHGVENYRKTEGNTFAYMLCSFKSGNSKTEGYKVITIPAQTYAIFPSGPFKWDKNFSDVLFELQNKFYTEWLPAADYEKTDGADFEIYGGDNETGYIELWYPVKLKAGSKKQY